MSIDLTETPIQRVDLPLIREKGVQLWIKREDTLHPQVSGNKWHKLKLNLEYAQREGFKRVLSFGGAYSNHLHALAWAGNVLGMETIGVVRGELSDPLNPTLADCKRWGMRLHSVSREEYRRRNDEQYVAKIKAQFGSCFVIPEGGANALGIAGCAAWGRQIQRQIDSASYVCLACGTGASLAGIAAGVNPGVRVLGFSALKGDVEMESRIERWLAAFDSHAPWEIQRSYHFGGFAKITAALVSFIDRWRRDTQIPLEPIYTAKLMYGVMDLIRQDYFPDGSRIVAIHSGGLQGIRGMQDRLASRQPRPAVFDFPPNLAE